MWTSWWTKSLVAARDPLLPWRGFAAVPPMPIGAAALTAGGDGMRDRSPGAAARAPHPVEEAELPPPEVIDFIRYCYRRRRVGWPEIYDDMCAVAARREFNGWDHADLSEHGV